jgi:hypothetical protein
MIWPDMIPPQVDNTRRVGAPALQDSRPETSKGVQRIRGRRALRPSPQWAAEDPAIRPVS